MFRAAENRFVLRGFNFLRPFFQMSLLLLYSVLLPVTHPKTHVRLCIALELALSGSFVSL